MLSFCVYYLGFSSNNIHGVDIDAQAVEVTKLSLLLKVLEEESGQLSLGLERVLPDLGRNIQCGNSLIGEDYFAGQLIVDEKERQRVNPFDWERSFPSVFAKGGFDAVIGNPPYIRIQAMKEWAPTEVEFFKKRYKAASKGNYDIYVVFVEKGMSLINLYGKLGFILPHKFFNAQYGEPLRGLIASGKHLFKVIHFGDQQIFENATTYTCLLFLNKKQQDEFDFVRIHKLTDWKNESESFVEKVPAPNAQNQEWNFSVGKNADLFLKLDEMPTKLGDLSNIFVGLQTSADTVFLFKEFQKKCDGIIEVKSKELGKWIEIEEGILKKVIRSGSIGRYWAKTTAYVLFPYSVQDNVAKLMSENDLRNKFPLAWSYLNLNKKTLEAREQNSFKDSQWFRFGRTQNLGIWEQPKLLIPYMITNLSGYYDSTDNYYFINVTTGGFGVTLIDKNINIHYLCGLFNSKLLDFYLKKVSSTFHGGYYAANKQYIEKLPVYKIDFSKPAEVKQHDRMVALVERMLELHKRTPSSLASLGGAKTATTPQEQERLTRDIASTDREIDKLVYELYGLSEEEIKIVEGG